MLDITDFANYADDTTSHGIRDCSKEATDSLKNAADDLFFWFASNQMKANPDECHLIASCDNEVMICASN